MFDDLIRKKFRYDPETGLLHRGVSRVGYPDREGYLVFVFRKQLLRVHRVAFFLQTGRWPTMVDHRNRIKNDNRWSNLEETTYSKNGLNRGPGCGVSYLRKQARWVAYIKLKGKHIHLGTFLTEAEARLARQKAEADVKDVA